MIVSVVWLWLCDAIIVTWHYVCVQVPYHRIWYWSTTHTHHTTHTWGNSLLYYFSNERATLERLWSIRSLASKRLIKYFLWHCTKAWFIYPCQYSNLFPSPISISKHGLLGSYSQWWLYKICILVTKCSHYVSAVLACLEELEKIVREVQLNVELQIVW